MACGCNKGKTAAANPTVAAAEKAERERAARAATATASLTPRTPVPAQGGTQSFALRMSDGRTQSFGSLLEARASQARVGGTLIG